MSFKDATEDYGWQWGRIVEAGGVGILSLTDNT
jgi:hypothetical protein